MLSLPLEKLWGAGTKTQERLRSAGLRTTADIHARQLPLLTSLFGQSTGTFLYNAVRGNMAMKFGEEAKNHSISSEETFDFDLSVQDKDVIREITSLFLPLVKPKN